jgi:hypothetical protein
MRHSFWGGSVLVSRPIIVETPNYIDTFCVLCRTLCVARSSDAWAARNLLSAGGPQKSP